ncbi:MAG: LysM peptidoglycan-binding domain-containing protein [Leptospiraceae bacterium]|nr:LysM peptidoglycan-binding domain-containing protein [Leptospiraceae bacterium]
MDAQFLNTRIVKAFRHVAPLELPEQPVHAIKGLSEHDGELLYESFWVKTIRDLADLKFVHWAQEICALRDVPQEKIDMSGFRDKLNKAYEQTSIKVLMKSPVHVLQGLSEGDADRLEEAFRIHSVKDLANLKFARYAQEICGEAYKDLSAPIRKPGNHGVSKRTAKSGSRFTALLLLLGTVLVICIISFFWPFGLSWLENKNPAANSPDSSTARQTESADDHSSDRSNPSDLADPADQTESEVERNGQDSADSANSNPSADPNSEERLNGDGTEYHVQAGDTLSDISKRLFGTTKRWPEIYELNRAQLKDPGKIYPGTTLRIPAR